MKDMTIAVDIAKDVFEIGTSSEPGKVDTTHRISRAKFLRFFANRASARVVMEACGSAHHWGRELEAWISFNDLTFAGERQVIGSSDGGSPLVTSSPS